MGNVEDKPVNTNIPTGFQKPPTRGRVDSLGLDRLVDSLSASFGIHKAKELILPDNVIIYILGINLPTFRVARQFSRNWYQMSFSGELMDFHLTSWVRVCVPSKGFQLHTIRCKISDKISHVHEEMQELGYLDQTLDDGGYFFPAQLDRPGKWLELDDTIKELKIGWAPVLEYKTKFRKLIVNVANVWKTIVVNDSQTVEDITKTVCKATKLPQGVFSLHLPKAGPTSIYLLKNKTLHDQNWDVGSDDELELDEAPFDDDEQREIISKALPLKLLFQSHKAAFLRGTYECTVDVAIFLAALILHICLGPYSDDVEYWKPRKILPPQFCNKYHKRILTPIYEKYATLRAVSSIVAQKKFVNITFSLSRTTYFRCLADGFIAKHQAMLGLNRDHIIKADAKTLKPMSLFPWEEIDDESECKRCIWRWDELISWNQHGNIVTLVFPQVGRIELKSNYAKEIAFFLEHWTSRRGSPIVSPQQRRKSQQQHQRNDPQFQDRFDDLTDESGSDTLGSWESMSNDKEDQVLLKPTLVISPESRRARIVDESSSDDGAGLGSGSGSGSAGDDTEDDFVMLSKNSEIPKKKKSSSNRTVITTKPREEKPPATPPPVRVVDEKSPQQEPEAPSTPSELTPTKGGGDDLEEINLESDSVTSEDFIMLGSNLPPSVDEQLGDIIEFTSFV